jgi:PBP4 family serine-type D-alanyl-D-alanine carboxypeptidase
MSKPYVVTKRKIAYRLFLLGGLAISTPVLAAPPSQSLAGRIQSIVDRSEFVNSSFGIEFYSVRDKTVLYSLNAQKFFAPASGAKIFVQAAALAALGADYRFHTKVYRTGPISDGILKGDLVLVASGDPNLSNRIQPDGTLAFTNVDHSYAPLLPGTTVPGDPLLVIRELAKQIAGNGIKRVEGRVLVDATLFQQTIAMSGAIVSPIVINDNIIDVTVGAGAADGPAVLRASPETAFTNFVNQTKTVTTGRAGVRFGKDTLNSDGSHSVIVTGTVLTEAAPILLPYKVSEPIKNAQAALATALRDAGVKVGIDRDVIADFKGLSQNYDPAHLVAEHVSPPLSEESKVTLKVSENLHAALMPSILGAVVAHAGENAQTAGLNIQRDYFEKAGLDLTAAAQADGAGGGALYTPDFTVKFLEYLTHQSYFPQFLAALPVLGKDGTLFDAQVTSPAAGHVFAKTGSALGIDPLSRSALLNAKALVGYLDAANGDRIAFAIYLGPTKIKDVGDLEKIGDELGEIATAVYQASGKASPKRTRK